MRDMPNMPKRAAMTSNGQTSFGHLHDRFDLELFGVTLVAHGISLLCKKSPKRCIASL